MYRPSAEIAGAELGPFASLPAEATDTRLVMPCTLFPVAGSTAASTRGAGASGHPIRRNGVDAHHDPLP
jgi:hypothetical protein